jgi:LuxR family maltose regulon positive regulatory protein
MQRSWCNPERDDANAMRQVTLTSVPTEADADPRASAEADRLVEAGDEQQRSSHPRVGRGVLAGARAIERGGPSDETVGDPRSAPPFGAGLVSRPRLVRRLLEDRRAPVAVVYAPAGYGKTSLLAEWAERDERACSWIRLEPRHAHAPALLEEIMLALDALEPLDTALLEACAGAARDRRPHEPLDALATSVAAIGERGQPAMLVIDNAHVIDNLPARQVLSVLARSVPPGSILALASRSEPPLARGRLRAEQRLLEIDASDLAFTDHEAQLLFRAAGVELDGETMRRSLVVAEGWPVALCLAARSIRSDSHVWTPPLGFDGPDRAVSEYIRQELLDSLPQELREFLRRCSIVDRLAPHLCDAMLERSDSAAALDALASRDLVLLPVDPGSAWYRCHPLVRDVLRCELDIREPGAVETLSDRASDWFEQHEDLDRAIDQALAAGRAEHAGELLWRRAPDCLARGADPQIESWLHEIGEKQAAGSARLALCAAVSHIADPDVTAVERWTEAAARALAQHPELADSPVEGALAVVKAALARNGLEEMGRAAAQADSLLEDNTPWRSFAWLLRGVADHIEGAHADARVALENGVRASTAPTPLIDSLCLAQLSMIDADEGDDAWAADRCEDAVGLLTSHDLTDEPLATFVFAVSAGIAGRSGRADVAKRRVARVIQMLDQVDGFLPWYEVQVRILLARASLRLADVFTARSALALASRALRRIPDASNLHSWLEAEWAEVDEYSASALSGPAALTIAELRILRFLPTHLSFREIGERLQVSTNTVKTQAHAVYAKLGASSRSQAVARASALGLIEAAVV